MILALTLALAFPARAQEGFEPIEGDGMKLQDPLSLPESAPRPTGAAEKSLEEEFPAPTDVPQVERSPKPVVKPTPAPPPTPPPKAAAPAAKPAKKAASKGSQRGVIIAEEGGTVFKEPNFDAQVIATVNPGQVFDISSGTREGFYKIRLKPGTLGWISEVEIRAVGAKENKAAKGAPAKPGAKKKETAQKKKRGKPVHMTRYTGPVFEFMNYRESTMKGLRSESLMMYGWRWSGPNTLIDGAMNIDSEILIHPSPPKFYETATGNKTSGFLLIGNFIFVSEMPQSKNLMAYYGFGPTFKFAQYNVQLSDDPTPGKTRSYNLTDMTLGAVFAVGLATAIGDRYAVRLDGRYYWETQRYTSLSLALQMDF